MRLMIATQMRNQRLPGARIVLAACIVCLGSLAGARDFVSPDARYSVRVSSLDDGSQEVAVFDEQVGTKLGSILSGVSKVRMQASWSPDSKQMIIRADYGTRMSLLEAVEITEDGLRERPVADRDGKADFEKSDVVVLGWKNGGLWFLSIVRGSINHFRIEPDDWRNPDRKVFAHLKLQEHADARAIPELIRKRPVDFANEGSAPR